MRPRWGWTVYGQIQHESKPAFAVILLGNSTTPDFISGARLASRVHDRKKVLIVAEPQNAAFDEDITRPACTLQRKQQDTFSKTG